MITWKEAKGKEILCKIEDAPGNLIMKSVKYPGLEVQLQRNEVSKGERILGVRLALDGNDNDKFKYRKQQSKVLAGKIESSPFS